jgi:hypothetical protein
MIEYLYIFVTSAIFGASLKINDLLSEHNFKWFKGSFLFLSLISIISFILTLELSENNLILFWTAIIFSWIFRGRIDCINHGITFSAILIYVFLFHNNVINNQFLQFFILFFAFSFLGWIHDIYQYNKVKKFRILYKILYKNQYIYWIGLVLIFSVFTRSYLSIISVISFVLSYSFFYSKTSKRIMKIVGIKSTN